MVLNQLKPEGLLPSTYSFLLKPGLALQNLQIIGEKILGLDQPEPLVPERIDYLNDFR
jgi:hypothetical protein